jgi:ATP/maltotriose-dependent transcriptional regulator MalT
MMGFCRHHYGAVYVWRGQWSEAEAQLEGAVDAYSRSRPAFAGGAVAALAELRRRQGRWDEAQRLLDELGDSSALGCRARIALDRGAARKAAELAQRALRQTPGKTRLQRAPALEVLIAALTARGELEEAREALAELENLARLVGTVPLRAATNFADGIVTAAGGDHERARRLLEDAVDGFVNSGAPFEAAQARLELASCLIAMGRDGEAATELRLCLDSLELLGAEAEVRRGRKMLEQTADGSRQSRTLGDITRREREVLRHVAEGLTNREIAERLFVSEHTVHRHVTNILRKLGLPTRTAAAAHAIRAGLLDSSGA